MLNLTQDIQSLTTFKRDTVGSLKRLKKSGRPLVLTVQGRAAAVVMTAERYQEMAEQLDTISALRRGMAQARKGLGTPAEEFFAALEREP